MFRFALLLMLVSTELCASGNPGVRLRLTKTGIDYANKLVLAEIIHELKSLLIPDQSGHDGHISYTLTSIKVTGLSPPISSISLVPKKNGFSLAVTKLGMSIKGNWKVEYKQGFVHIQTSGSVDVSVSGMNLAETASFGIDHTGRPSVASSGCSATVGGVSVSFHGGTAFIVNLFRHTVEDKIRDILPSKVCSAVVGVVDKNAEKSLSTLPVTIQVADRFLVDYRLVASPNISNSYAEVFDKGEVFWKADLKEAPFSPQPLPALTDTSRHVYIWMSEYTPNSFLYQAHTHGYLKYNVTKNDLPSDNKSYLNTTCKLKCVGTIIPQIGHKYPNSTVKLGFETMAVPNATMTNKTLDVNVKSLVTLWAQTPTNTTAFLATLIVNASLTAQPSIKNERLTAVITDHTFKLSVVKSAVGQLFPAVYNAVIEGILTIVVIPELNAVAAKGAQLPVVEGVQFNNTVLLVQPGNLLIGTDLKYKSVQG
ncbi:bactericidal permeability increasing protein [Elysia marginata]|uniref:Bactericidal permeability increasing protein n=1 Tax=Elysia marginata TaxID=1093978 RepID=A0AAV4E8I8_9GAST|nr:bactericidal permeability increasing protein [Elysia marginata]